MNTLILQEKHIQEAIESVVYLSRLDEDDIRMMAAVHDGVAVYLIIQPIALVIRDRNGVVSVQATNRAGVLMRSLQALSREKGELLCVVTRTHILQQESLAGLNCYLRADPGLFCFRRVARNGGTGREALGNCRWSTRFGWRDLNEHLSFKWERLPFEYQQMLNETLNGRLAVGVG